jgi:hypothetical protein
VADFWKEIGSMSKTDALAQLEKFFYQGLEHKGVQLPAAINFTHYTARSKSLKPLMNLNLDSLHQQKAQPMGWI